MIAQIKLTSMFEDKNRICIKTLVPLRLLSSIDLGCTLSWQAEVKVNDYEIVVTFFHVSHNLI